MARPSGGPTGQAILAALARADGEGISRSALSATAADGALGGALRLLLRRELIAQTAAETYAIAIPLVAAYVRGEMLL